MLLLNILVPARLKSVVLLSKVWQQREAVCATELRVTVIIKENTVDFVRYSGLAFRTFVKIDIVRDKETDR